VRLVTTLEDISVLTRPHHPDDWTEVDSAAVDTIRVLAADAVHKVGNGHPGTAMSLAPLAYTLFQRQMRHDPSDTHWLGRDRFVLSAGHSSLTLYIQLYLGGFGLQLADIEALRTWGSKTPGHPEFRHTTGVEMTTGPLGRAWRRRSGWRWHHGMSAACSIRMPPKGPARSTTSSM
jgi:transketolase